MQTGVDVDMQGLRPGAHALGFEVWSLCLGLGFRVPAMGLPLWNKGFVHEGRATEAPKS